MNDQKPLVRASVSRPDQISAARRWPARTGPAIALWAGLWTLFIGGVGAILVVGNIRDARVRADVAQHAVIATATISGYGSPIYTSRGGCGKGGGAVVRFTVAGKVYTECVKRDGLPEDYAAYASIIPPPESGTYVAYKRGNPLIFFVSPNKIVPQRIINGVWRSWGIQTLILLVVFIPAISFFLYWRRRGRRA